MVEIIYYIFFCYTWWKIWKVNIHSFSLRYETPIIFDVLNSIFFFHSVSIFTATWHIIHKSDTYSDRVYETLIYLQSFILAKHFKHCYEISTFLIRFFSYLFFNAIYRKKKFTFLFWHWFKFFIRCAKLSAVQSVGNTRICRSEFIICKSRQLELLFVFIIKSEYTIGTIISMTVTLVKVFILSEIVKITSIIRTFVRTIPSYINSVKFIINFKHIVCMLTFLVAIMTFNALPIHHLLISESKTGTN